VAKEGTEAMRIRISSILYVNKYFDVYCSEVSKMFVVLCSFRTVFINYLNNKEVLERICL
jgi:hypothetical protein